MDSNRVNSLKFTCFFLLNSKNWRNPLTLLSRRQKTILEAYHDLDERICSIESKCPGPRIASNDAWIKYLEAQKSHEEKDIVQMPIHLVENENIEELELNYDQQEHLEQDAFSVAKVRRVCIITDFHFSLSHFWQLKSVRKRSCS